MRATPASRAYANDVPARAKPTSPGPALQELRDVHGPALPGPVVLDDCLPHVTGARIEAGAHARSSLLRWQQFLEDRIDGPRALPGRWVRGHPGRVRECVLGLDHPVAGNDDSARQVQLG